MRSFGLIATGLGSPVLVIVSLVRGNAPAAALWGASFVLCCYVIFRDTLNTVQYVGRVYWIVRDSTPPGTPLVARGFMRMVAAPWLIGSGVQVRVPGRVIQVGVCRPQDAPDETQGVLLALDGRLMTENPEEIGNWK